MRVDSVGEGISVRKVTPPGFVMILWEIRDSVSTRRGAEKGKKGQECFLGSLRGEGPVSIQETGAHGSWSPIFPNEH